MSLPPTTQCMVLPLVVKESRGRDFMPMPAPSGRHDGCFLTPGPYTLCGDLAGTGGVRKAVDRPWKTFHKLKPVAAMAASAPASAPAASGSDEDDCTKKARRFAKLLVEEIKLYNQPELKKADSTKTYMTA